MGFPEEHRYTGFYDGEPLPQGAVLAWGAYPGKKTEELLPQFQEHVAIVEVAGPTDENGPGVFAMGLYDLEIPVEWKDREGNTRSTTSLSLTVFGSMDEMMMFLKSPAGTNLIQDGRDKGLDLSFRAPADFRLPQLAELVYSKTIGSDLASALPKCRPWIGGVGTSA